MRVRKLPARLKLIRKVPKKYKSWPYRMACIALMIVIIFGSFVWWRPNRASAQTVFLTNTASTSWSVPSDWNNSANTIEVLGGGGGGGSGGPATGGGGGGGSGGGYAFASNVTLIPGSSIGINVGTGGAATVSGGDSYFCNSTASCANANDTNVLVSAGGGGGGNNSTSGTGGPASNAGIFVKGTSGFAGGTAAPGAAAGAQAGGDGGGGGGAAGPSSFGLSGSGSTGGSGDNGSGGAGGATDTAGSNGTEWDASHGSGGGGGGGTGGPRNGSGSPGQVAGTYGAGGGGGGGTGRSGPSPGAGAAGTQGIIVITYTPAPVTYDQNSYQWLDNANSLTPGGKLNGVNQNTATTLSSTGQAFRLRQLIKPNINVAAPNASFSTNTVTAGASLGSTPRSAVGNDGYARTAYKTSGGLSFLECTNSTCSSHTTPVVIDSNGIFQDSISVAIGSDGFAKITYSSGFDSFLRFVQCTNADCSSHATIQTVDSSVQAGLTSLSIGSDGFGRIAYNDLTDSTLNFVQCTNANCSTHATISTVDTNSSSVSMALGSDGFGRIGYRSSTGTLKFVQCTNASCSTHSSANTVDSSTNIGNISMALGSDGFGRIGYSDVAASNLNFVQCTNASCSTHATKSVVASADAIESMALGSDGFGRVAYYDTVNSLKFVQCTNAACSTNAGIVTVDSGGGGLDSLVWGGDDLGRISYVDQSSGNLKFAYQAPSGLFNEQYADLSSYGSCSAIPNGNWQSVGGGVQSTGTIIAGAGGDNSSNGGNLAWSSPGNVTAADSTFTASNVSSGQKTDYLTATNFGFSIPSGATINGIVATINKEEGIGFAIDNSVVLIKNGVIGSTDKADTVNQWPTVAADSNYGSLSDLWGLSLTPSDVNSANFGVAFAAASTNSFPDPAVDYIKMTVYYTPSPAITYSDNVSVSSGSDISGYTTANDPTESGQTVQPETYSENDGFYNTTSFGGTVDGMWDLSLKDNGAPGNTTYCLRTVKADGTPLDTYTQYPMITTASANSPPAAPTLLDPASGATSVSTTPQFDLRTTDADSDNLTYRIYLYQSNCSTSVGTFTQSANQTGWTNQDADSGTTYTSSPTLSLSRIAFYQYQSSLTTNTTYCWKADATDANGYGSTSSTQLFTTAVSNDRPVNIKGGVNIKGNTIIR